MTKKYSTKRALLASVLMLAMCFSMLVGTTFAWFTDSVTSSGNIIKTGKLDVEMYWADGTKEIPAADSEDWIDASTGAIFDYDLWEPGYVQVRHIKIANLGDLAIKYKVNIVPNGEVTDLTDVIDVYYVDPAVQVADRTALTDENKLGTLTTVLAGLGETGNGTLVAGASDTITIAFKMKETAGNNYMNKSIGTDFSIQLLATQFTFESDSFGSDYDSSATYPEIGSATIKENSGATTINAGNVSVTVPAGSPEGKYEVVVTNQNASTDANGETTYTADIDFLKDGVKVERNGNTVYSVAIQLETEKSIVKVLHKGNEVTDYDYDSTTGILTFETDSFSPFSVIYEENKTVTVSSSAEFLSAIATATYGTVIDATGVTIDINDIGDDYPNGKKSYIIPGGITIKNLEVLGSYRGGNFIMFNNTPDQTIIFENCSFTPGGRAMAIGFSTSEGTNCSAVFNNCTFKGTISLDFAKNDSSSLTFNNCTITKHSYGQNYVLATGGTHTFNACTFDYTGVTQTNLGVNIYTGAINSKNDSDNDYSTAVILDGCTLINCKTNRDGANSTLTIK